MPLTQQLATARKYLMHLKAKQHADVPAFEAIVATLEKLVDLEQVSAEMKGEKV